MMFIVVRFGRADYNYAVIEGDINDLDRTWQKVLNQSTANYER